MKIVFVILHYLTVADTMACVDSILTQVTAGPASACEIVIVDNASPDGSGDQLARCYAGQKPVHLLRAPENLGFARGHNLGYQFAKNNLRADYIILLNNDTRISQPDFISKLEQIARATPFDVLGPDICTPDGRHQNPKALRGYTPVALRKKIARVRRDLLLTRTGLYGLVAAWNQRKVRVSAPDAVGSHTQASDLTTEGETGLIRNCVLHGSCLIFSPRYIQRYRGLFSQTFLYGEEEILWQIAQAESLSLIYTPALSIDHLEDRATSAQNRSNRRRRLFKLTQELASLRQLQAIQQDCRIYQLDLYESAGESTVRSAETILKSEER